MACFVSCIISVIFFWKVMKYELNDYAVNTIKF